jgi:hypothetical protein
VVALSHQPTGDALQRTVNDFDAISFFDEGRGIVAKSTGHESLQSFDFMIGQRRQFATERDDAGNRRAPENPEVIGGIETREAIAGEQWPVDGLLAVLPPAPARERGQKDFDFSGVELVAYDLLGTSPRANGEPGLRLQTKLPRVYCVN